LIEIELFIDMDSNKNIITRLDLATRSNLAKGRGGEILALLT
jgi:hypothetical protein